MNTQGQSVGSRETAPLSEDVSCSEESNFGVCGRERNPVSSSVFCAIQGCLPVSQWMKV